MRFAMLQSAGPTELRYIWYESLMTLVIQGHEAPLTTEYQNGTSKVARKALNVEKI